MNVHFSYKLHRTPDIEREIQHGTDKLRKRLQVFRPELVHLKGSLEQNSAREGTTVSLNLRLPSGQMAVQESATSASAALKTAFDELLGQVGKHKDLLRSSHKWRRRRSSNGRPVQQVPFEETIASVPPLTVTGDEIRSYVNTNFPRLENYVEREIYFRESSGDLEPGNVSAPEIVDETVAFALDDRSEKPDRMGLEPWFYRLAIRALDSAVSRLPEPGTSIHLDAGRTQRRERASDEARLQFHQPDENIGAESTIPDRGASTPEEIAYRDEIITLVQFALRGARPEDREAFILHALEGFSADEISAITDRKREDVERSIAQARATLRRHLPTDNRFTKDLLQETGTR